MIIKLKQAVIYLVKKKNFFTNLFLFLIFFATNLAERQNSVEEPNEEDAGENLLSEYEQQRLQRIEENNKTLLKLVSISFLYTYRFLTISLMCNLIC